MLKSEELKQEREALRVELSDTLAKFEKAENVSADDWTAYRTKESEWSALAGEIQQAEEIEAALKDRAKLAAANAPTGRTEVHNRAEDKPWNSFGEFLQAVAAVEMNHEIDPRLRQDLAASGAQEKVGADGGFLVREEYSTQLLNRGREAAVIAPRCTQIPLTTGNSIALPFIKETSRATGSRWGGVQIYRRDEAGTVTATKPAFDRMEIKAEPLMGLAYSTDELLEDAAALEAVFGNAFASEFAFKIDDEIINGDGAGKCLGILAANCFVSQAKESGQAAATVVHENLTNIWSRVPARSKSRGAWFINSEVWPQLENMNLAVGTGGAPTFIPARGDADAPLGRLKGRPIIEIEQAPALGTVGDIVFADFSQYLLVTKGGLKADQSMHVRFIYGEQTFRWTHRINGQPAWTSALTPYKGSKTKSPFIGIATRS